MELQLCNPKYIELWLRIFMIIWEQKANFIIWRGFTVVVLPQTAWWSLHEKAGRHQEVPRDWKYTATWLHTQWLFPATLSFNVKTSNTSTRSLASVSVLCLCVSRRLLRVTGWLQLWGTLKTQTASDSQLRLEMDLSSKYKQYSWQTHARGDTFLGLLRLLSELLVYICSLCIFLAESLCHCVSVQTSLYFSSHAKQKERRCSSLDCVRRKSLQHIWSWWPTLAVSAGGTNKGVCFLLSILTEHRWFLVVCLPWTVDSQCNGLHHSDLNFMSFAKW